MNRKHFKQKSAFLISITYLIFAVLASTWIVARNRIVLDYPQAVQDNSELFAKMEEKVPVRIQLYNSRWGSADITSSSMALSLWEQINALPRAGGTQAPMPVFHQDSDTIGGTIQFLNDDIMEFELSDYLRLDGLLYGTDHTSFEINWLYRELQTHLHSVKNLQRMILNSTNQIILSNDANRRLDLSDTMRKDLSETLLQCQPAPRKSEKGNLLAVIAIYLGKAGHTAAFPQATYTDILMLSVYPDDYFEVYDMKSGLTALSLSGPIGTYCEELLGH